jgi:hypothetical protein
MKILKLYNSNPDNLRDFDYFRIKSKTPTGQDEFNLRF